MAKRPRIDQTIYPDGSVACTVVIKGQTVHRTRRYSREDRDGTVPGLRALRAARDWIEKHSARAAAAR